MLYRFPDAFVQAAHNWKLSMQTIATLGKPKKCMYIQQFNTYAMVWSSSPLSRFVVTGTHPPFCRDWYPSPVLSWLVPLSGFVVIGTPLPWCREWVGVYSARFVGATPAQGHLIYVSLVRGCDTRLGSTYQLPCSGEWNCIWRCRGGTSTMASGLQSLSALRKRWPSGAQFMAWVSWRPLSSASGSPRKSGTEQVIVGWCWQTLIYRRMKVALTIA